MKIELVTFGDLTESNQNKIINIWNFECFQDWKDMGLGQPFDYHLSEDVRRKKKYVCILSNRKYLFLL